MGWISPTGHDAGTNWTNPANAYDGSLGTYASRSSSRTFWVSYLELTCNMSTDKVRVYATFTTTYSTDQMQIDVYYSSAWHNIYDVADGSWRLTWVEAEIGSTETITGIRVRGKYAGAYGSYTMQVYGVEINEVSTTVEATSTIGISTLFSGSLSKGVTEQAITTISFDTLFEGSVSKGITEQAISTISFSTLFEGNLRHGKTEQAIATINFDTLFSAELKQYRYKNVTGTINFDTLFEGSVSKGITEQATATINIGTLFSGELSKRVFNTQATLDILRNQSEFTIEE